MIGMFPLEALTIIKMPEPNPVKTAF